MAQIPLAAVFSLDELLEHASSSVLKSPDSTTITSLTKIAQQDGYDTICIPLTNDSWRSRWKEMCLTDGPKQDSEVERRAEEWRAAEGPFQKKELNITRLDEAANAIGLVSEWLELDSADSGVRYDSEIALKQELTFAAYLNLQAVILPPPRNRQFAADYGRSVNSALLSTSTFLHVSIRIPIYDPRSSSSSTIIQPPASTNTPLSVRARAPDGDLSSTWEIWDTIRTICDYSPRLSLTLDLSLPLPLSAGVLGRWNSEPCYHVLLPATSFIANAKGYPVLTKATQQFLREMIKHGPTILIPGTKSHVHANGGHLAYSQYVRHLERTSPSVVAAHKPGTIENFAKGYWDYLQSPLQPLMDNLASATYETFERDPVKYERYEEAVFQAVSDLKIPGRTIICLAGAGRGAIVSRCLQALDRSRRNGIIYAVEKNPSAYVTLQERKEKEWGNRVVVIFGDMRKVDVPEKADILVSELLGSFGDNEASPECLDGAMRFLKPNGISIPASYTAYLAPISSSKLHAEVQVNSIKVNLETPYVVMFQAINTLSGEGGGLRGSCGTRIQECWSFTHPRRDAVLDAHGLPITNSHNTRSAQLNFHIPHAGVLHGLAGYFDAILYGDVGLSIHPDSKEQISPNMLSWFPMFFPFREPLYLPSNSELHVSIWRLTTKSKIWYEWFAESHLPVISQPPPFGPPRIPDKTGANSQNPGHTKGGSSSATSISSNFLTPITVNMPSPLLSPIPSPVHMSEENAWDLLPNAVGGISIGENPSSKSRETTIKIGQTTLHNPGGRGSWTGL